MSVNSKTVAYDFAVDNMRPLSVVLLTLFWS